MDLIPDTRLRLGLGEMPATPLLFLTGGQPIYSLKSPLFYSVAPNAFGGRALKYAG
jgi:hypothetical protein